MHTAEMYRYPFKSGKAEPLLASDVKLTGLELDRFCMAVTAETHELASQRMKGAQILALVRTAWHEKGAEFYAPGEKSVFVPYDLGDAPCFPVTMHGKTLLGQDAGDGAARWISDLIPPFKGQSFRVVAFPKDYTRSTTDRYTDAESAVTQFADGYALHITSRESLDDLNVRLVERGVNPVEMSVMRPNLVIAEIEPWGEDRLRHIRIGEVEAEIVKPCGRCLMTEVNQETGDFSKDHMEPRDTLKEFHAGRHLLAEFPNLQDDLLNTAMFGQNAIVIKPGRVQVGDEIEVLSRRG